MTMKTILLTSFWLSVVGGSVKLLCLAIANYPRVIKHSRVEDAISLACSVGWCVWLGWTLWQ